MAVARKWASLISGIASFVFSFIIVFQIPLFRIGCRNKKRCESPIEVIIYSELIGSHEVIPSSIVKTLLYPGTIAKSLIAASGFFHFSFSTDIHHHHLHLEVFVGSCLCLLGALLSIFKARRVSFIGTLLIFWGLIKEIDDSSVGVYPTLFLASLSAFLSIRRDVRKIIRCCTSKPLSKSL